MIIGIDPGLGGALATYNYRDGAVACIDMPVFQMTVGKKTRSRVDAVAVLDYFAIQKIMGVELVIMEAVGGRPKQGAGAAFVFGYTVGLLYMAAIANRIPVETIAPQVWKRILAVPGKRNKRAAAGEAVETKTNKEMNGAIIQRADQLMPDYTHLWRGPQGGYKVDRAEAAMLAYYGGKYAFNSTKVVNLTDTELALAYLAADTGS